MVVLSEGEHVPEKTLDITCSNISFIGQGKDKTTVRGGIGVENKKNVTVKSLTLTIPTGVGLDVEGEEASVEMMDVSVKDCQYSGLYVDSGASVKATQCEFSENRSYGVSVTGGSKGIFTDCTFHHNGDDGVYAQELFFSHHSQSLVELRGERTEIHHSGQVGLVAYSNAIINIYIPSRSITALVHDHSWRDLNTYIGGKIQSQLSSSSLELTVIQEAPEDVIEF